MKHPNGRPGTYRNFLHWTMTQNCDADAKTESVSSALEYLNVVRPCLECCLEGQNFKN